MSFPALTKERLVPALEALEVTPQPLDNGMVAVGFESFHAVFTVSEDALSCVGVWGKEMTEPSDANRAIGVANILNRRNPAVRFATHDNRETGVTKLTASRVFLVGEGISDEQLQKLLRYFFESITAGFMKSAEFYGEEF